MANTSRLLVSNFYHPINILTNINDIPKVYSYHLAIALTNINNISKIDPYYIAIALTNINDEVNNFISKDVGYV